MSIYTTPLQFGYFFSLAMWLVFLYRGFVQNRLSDKLLGWLMFLLAIELQDYMFGFSGINVLWNELKGFPRSVSLLSGPLIYLYFRSQINRSFRLKRRELLHFIPYAIYATYHLIFFVQGPDVVQWLEESDFDNVLFYVLVVAEWLSYIIYLAICLVIYKRYKQWSLNQFSNSELINFNWFRNFIYAMLLWLIVREFMHILDIIFELSYYLDWWWNLVLVVVSFYIGLAGYSQTQPAQMSFEFESINPLHFITNKKTEETPKKVDKLDEKIHQLAIRLEQIMSEKQLFLNHDLNLQDLAKHVKSNSVELSSTINQKFEKNFNDYINTLRIDEFIRLSQDAKRSHFTLLTNAYDAGFNSKSTFNRAFKKIKGVSPREYLIRAKNRY